MDAQTDVLNATSSGQTGRNESIWRGRILTKLTDIHRSRFWDIPLYLIEGYYIFLISYSYSTSERERERGRENDSSSTWRPTWMPRQAKPFEEYLKLNGDSVSQRSSHYWLKEYKLEKNQQNDGILNVTHFEKYFLPLERKLNTGRWLEASEMCEWKVPVSSLNWFEWSINLFWNEVWSEVAKLDLNLFLKQMHLSEDIESGSEISLGVTLTIVARAALSINCNT